MAAGAPFNISGAVPTVPVEPICASLAPAGSLTPSAPYGITRHRGIRPEYGSQWARINPRKIPCPASATTDNGLGYNFYNEKNRARADDLLVREKAATS